ncbi:MAG: putative lipid II flippase FtsW [Acidimicrobiales bacterium]
MSEASVTPHPRAARAASGRKGARLRTAPPAGRRSGAFVAIFALVAVLCLTGMVMVLSASSVASIEDYGSPWYQFGRQALWLGVGIVGFVVALRIDYRRWRSWTRYLLWVSLAMLVLVLVPGVGVVVNGARRWLGFGPFTVQPSEFAKLALLLFAADLLARRANRVADPQQALRPVLAVFAMMAVLVMIQPNLGTTIILFVMTFVLLFVAGVPGRQLGLLGLAAAAAGVLFAIIEPYRMRRITAFLDPWSDPANVGYQNIQSAAAIANGGLVGTGVGQGRAKYGYLPEADTDFIFSVIGEELGFLGAMVLLVLFLALGAAAIRVAMRAPDRFGMLVASGIAAWFLFQAVVNIGAAVGVMPTTGVPLPFVSAGGSSLLISLFAAGILCNIARHTS